MAKPEPFYKQVQKCFNSCEVWTRISTVDCGRVETEKLMSGTGIHNAHVVAYRDDKYDFSLSRRLDYLAEARKLGLTEF